MRAGGLFLVVVQLGLLIAVLHQFQIESDAFFRLAVLAFGGFVVHAVLPLRLRLPFFLVLSLAGIVLVLGATDAAWLFAVGLLLIGLCHLPTSFRVRGLLLVTAGALLVAQRAGWLPSFWSNSVWPILGSIFMFRLIVYFYEVRHDKSPSSLTQTLAYFFLLPNVCFPLFPVVDYKTFKRNYYDKDAYHTYQTGVDWMARGVLHLVMYRYVYLHLTLPPSEVLSAGDWVRYVLSTYLLYLRISGQFHLVIGMLYLFGFSLPETHHRYLLASSFTDFWRRINIYWKDFMMKLVYYPSFFALKGLGGRVGMIGATITVFVATWILHSYQWFWLRGGFPVETQDVLFWGVLGVLVVYGSLRDMDKPRQRTVSRDTRLAVYPLLKTLATFCSICVLWSLWSADSMISWMTMFIVTWHFSTASLVLVAVVFGGILIATIAESLPARGMRRSLPFYGRPAVYSHGLLLVLLLLGSTDLYGSRLPVVASTVATLRRSSLNATDAALQHKGYYEKLDSESRMSTQLWGAQSKKPAHWVGLSETEAYRTRDDLLGGDLQPDADIVFEDQRLTANRWGMRDAEIELAKPANTYRIAVLGPSHVMGSGVANGETFPDFLEARLNLAHVNSKTRFEVLNFGVAGYSLVRQLAMLEDRALPFQPDAVFVTDSPRPDQRIEGHLLNFIAAGHQLPYPELDALIRGTGVHALAHDGLAVPFDTLRRLGGAVGVPTRMPWTEAERRLRFVSDDVVSWILHRMAKVTRQHGAVPVFVALDVVTDSPMADMKVARHAESAGMLFFDLFDVWSARDRPSLRIGDWDLHPNADGYRVVAARLVELIDQHHAELRITPSGPSDSPPGIASGR